MIITRTAETVVFQLSESRRICIDVAEVSAVSLVIGRLGNGRLAPALELQRGSRYPERIEASLDCLSVVHARLVELMTEIAGPPACAAMQDLGALEPFHC